METDPSPSPNVVCQQTEEKRDDSLLTTTSSHIPHPTKQPRPGRRYIAKGSKRRAPYSVNYEFFLDDQDNVRAECVHCDSTFAADSARNGNKNLKAHSAICEKNPLNKGKEKGEERAKKVKKFAESLFDEYRRMYAPSNLQSGDSGESSTMVQSIPSTKGGSVDLMNSISEQVKMKMRGCDTGNKFLRTEFDRYLDEIMGDDEEKEMVQALICGQDWIRALLRKKKLDMEENLQELENLEKDLKDVNIEDDLIFVTE
ncbi:unnamed protein product [Cuscuta campestris]|uniref:BED-type domain-containing protein n=1 Tax=Cuscuta campestris TaxID=132261 RepID=A0A484KY66_9ASTE|nr:unnamed protein product [Cuscuta campestris]